MLAAGVGLWDCSRRLALAMTQSRDTPLRAPRSASSGFSNIGSAWSKCQPWQALCVPSPPCSLRTRTTRLPHCEPRHLLLRDSEVHPGQAVRVAVTTIVVYGIVTVLPMPSMAAPTPARISDSLSGGTRVRIPCVGNWSSHSSRL